MECSPQLLTNLREFVTTLSIPIFGLPPDDVHAALDADVVLRQYLEDDRVFSLILRRNFPPPPLEADSEDADAEEVEYEPLSLYLNLTPVPREPLPWLAVMKRQHPIDDTKPMHTQLHFAFNAGSVPVDILHTMLRRGILASSGLRGGDIARKTSELEALTAQLQRTNIVPEVSLTLIPAIDTFVKQQGAKRLEPYSDCPLVTTLTDDDSKLLHKRLIYWTDAARALMSLTRDVNCGGALEEVEFWRAKHKQLLVVRNERDYPEARFAFQLTFDRLPKLQRMRFQERWGHSDVTKSLSDAAVVVAALEFLDAPLKRLYSHNTTLEDTQVAAKELLDLATAKDARSQLEAAYTKTLRQPERFVGLLGALSRDCANRVLCLISARRVLGLGLAEGEKVLSSASVTISGFIDLVKEASQRVGVAVGAEGGADVTRLEHLLARIKQVTEIFREYHNFMKGLERVGAATASHRQHLADAFDVFRQALEVTADEASVQGASGLGMTMGMTLGMTLGGTMGTTMGGTVLSQASTTHSSATDGFGTTMLAPGRDLQMSSADAAKLAAAFSGQEEQGGDFAALFDVSAKGTQFFVHRHLNYQRSLAIQQESIVSLMQRDLERCISATELFTLFTKYRPLLDRPGIRDALSEVQTRLLALVSRDVETLVEHFHSRLNSGELVPKDYSSTEFATTVASLGLTPSEGRLHWSLRLHAALDDYGSRLSAVLGDDWRQTHQGRMLVDQLRAARQLLPVPRVLLTDWMVDTVRAVTPHLTRSPVDHRVIFKGPVFGLKAGDAPATSRLFVTLPPQVLALVQERSAFRQFVPPMSFVVGVSIAKGRLGNFSVQGRAATFTDIVSATLEIVGAARSVSDALRQFAAAETTYTQITELMPTLAVALPPAAASLLDSTRAAAAEAITYMAGFTWEEISERVFRPHLAQVCDATPAAAATCPIVGAPTPEGVRLPWVSYLPGVCHAYGDAAINVMAAFSEIESLLAEVQTCADPVLPSTLVQIQGVLRRLYSAGLAADVVFEFVQGVSDIVLELLRSRFISRLTSITADTLPPIKAELRFSRKGTVSAQPSPATIKAEHVAFIDTLVQFYCSLPRVNIFVYRDVDARARGTEGVTPQCLAALDARSKALETYSRAFIDDPEVIAAIGAALDVVEGIQTQIAEICTDFAPYRTLWLAQPRDLAETLSTSLADWTAMLGGLRARRDWVLKTESDMRQTDPATGETTVSMLPLGRRRVIGSLVISPRTGVRDIARHFDDWYKELVERLAVVARQIGSQIYEGLCSRRSLAQNLELDRSADVQKVLADIVILAELVQGRTDLGGNLDELRQVERIVRAARRGAMPTDWIFTDMLTSELDALDSALEKKESSLAVHYGTLRQAAVDVDARTSVSIGDDVRQWGAEKPLSADVQPDDAIDFCMMMKGKFDEHSRQIKQLLAAKSVLDSVGQKMPQPKQPIPLRVLTEGSPKLIADTLQEVEQTASFWSSMTKAMAAETRLRQTAFRTIDSGSMKIQLDALLTELRELPESVRDFAGWAASVARIKAILQLVPMIGVLTGDTVKERHWRRLAANTGISAVATPLAETCRLEHVLAALGNERGSKNYKIADEVVQAAQGEAGLETFFTQLTEYWGVASFTLLPTALHPSAKVIGNWSDISAKLGEDVDALSSLRLSPYAKVFEVQAVDWESRLGRLNNLVELWMDAQRRWVHLQSVFGTFKSVAGGSMRDILENYRRAGAGFVGVMRDAARTPEIMVINDTLNAAPECALADRLQKCIDGFSATQRSLGEFLDRQRRTFPRLFFVGDDDLLELIGAGTDISKVQRHLIKIFAGISRVELAVPGVAAPTAAEIADRGEVRGMYSPEDEYVAFRTPIQLAQLWDAGSVAGRKLAADASAVHRFLIAVEDAMILTMRTLLGQTIAALRPLTKTMDSDKIVQWSTDWPNQLVIVACQVLFTEMMDAGAGAGVDALAPAGTFLSSMLSSIVTAPAATTPTHARARVALITELVNLQGVHTTVTAAAAADAGSLQFAWNKQMRFYAGTVKQGDSRVGDLSVQMASAVLSYGFEYIGIPSRIVSTELTQQCYLTLTQALALRLGGNPYGPAGTGKTETVKAMSLQLGRNCLVYCCDEVFSVSSMSRIFAGVCQTGSSVCLDEVNRLTPQVLSAVSGQLRTIQTALASGDKVVALPGVSEFPLVDGCGFFVTMNPGYAGRSDLPDSLKALFRPVSMQAPDRVRIAEVLLYAQGFSCARPLSVKTAPFFQLCAEQLSDQSHYEFGLRSLKAVLVTAGRVRAITPNPALPTDDPAYPAQLYALEEGVLLRAIVDTLLPKLVSADVYLFQRLCHDIFPGSDATASTYIALRQAVVRIARDGGLQPVADARAELASPLVPVRGWVDKCMQLYQTISLMHGVMLVGAAGAGKSVALRVLSQAIAETEGRPVRITVIDPKAIDKDDLYGFVDDMTREWTDGVLTATLRKVVEENGTTDLQRRTLHLIVLDGDVDAVWVENLNATLDDNKLLTLPSGERISLPDNCKIMFEVRDLEHATPATVSRCGMVWFAPDTVHVDAHIEAFCRKLERTPLSATKTWRDQQPGVMYFRTEDESKQQLVDPTPAPANTNTNSNSPEARARAVLEAQRAAAAVIRATVLAGREGSSYDDESCPGNGSGDGQTSPSILAQCLAQAATDGRLDVMEHTDARCLSTITSLLLDAAADCLQLGLTGPLLASSLSKRCVLALAWTAVSSFPNIYRADTARAAWERIAQALGAEVMPSVACLDEDGSSGLLDFIVDLPSGKWVSVSQSVPETTADAAGIGHVIVPTVDTARHGTLIRSWLAQQRPVLLCGPPGSGKTMTLVDTLRQLEGYDVAFINFSSGTGPEVVLKQLAHYCDRLSTPAGPVLRARIASQAGPAAQLVILCDEMNLPAPDQYGTQRVTALVRQLVERGGYWEVEAGVSRWIRVENVVFCGAANPPTDPGRHALSTRFLRHTPLVYVDYPSTTAMCQIYGVFTKAAIAGIRAVADLAGPLTKAMVEVYDHTQRGLAGKRPHFVYSPRELTRWCRAIYEAVAALPLANMVTMGVVVRIWYHEGMRLFYDRLVTEEEREWTINLLDTVAARHFSPCLPPNDLREALARPMLFGTWANGYYASVSAPEIKKIITSRLADWTDETGERIALHGEVVEHVLRLDRVLRQPVGHALLVGVSGCGRRTIARFVAYVNNFSVFQVRPHAAYTIANFEDDLRSVMTRAGVDNEKIVFLFDESAALSTAFLEHMNALLASGEVPGLFEGDELAQLIAKCKNSFGNAGSDHDKMLKMFNERVLRNLHVVFTMAPPSGDGMAGVATTSPALFNRCVVDWIGDWSDDSLRTVGEVLISDLDLGALDRLTGAEVPSAEYARQRRALVDTVVAIHHAAASAGERVAAQPGVFGAAAAVAAVTPRHFCSMLRALADLWSTRLQSFAAARERTARGLSAMRATETEVAGLQEGLAVQQKELQAAAAEAEAKLGAIVSQQQEAVVRKSELGSLQTQITERRAEIDRDQAAAMAELSSVQPLVDEAKNAVMGIQKSHLDELKALPKPPNGVRFTLEAVCLIIGLNPKEVGDWNNIKKRMRGDDFINTILNFDGRRLGQQPRLVQLLNTKYLSQPEFNFETINRVSRAAGPMVSWVISQLKYADISGRVEPLRRHCEELEEAARQIVEQAESTKNSLVELENNIEMWKRDYAALIQRCEGLKAAMAGVQAKVARSLRILDSLSSEKARWSEQSERFTAQAGSMLSRLLMTSASVAYAGGFYAPIRASLMTAWLDAAATAGLAIDDSVSGSVSAALESVLDTLSRPDERTGWESNGLPGDSVCRLNAAVQQMVGAAGLPKHRVPFVVDPSGQAMAWMTAQYACETEGGKLLVTSFLDTTFQTTLEKALRFGLPLLVTDAEHYNPVLNPILDREVAGSGRATIAGKDIDVSPAFRLTLLTRNDGATLPPGLVPRVSLINYTVTADSLRAQLLATVLAHDVPDVGRRRRQLIAEERQLADRLAALEDALLELLSGATRAGAGSILDNTQVLDQLEQTKAEAAEIAVRRAAAVSVREQLAQVTETYAPLVAFAADAFFSLVNMEAESRLYVSSLPQFVALYRSVADMPETLPPSASSSPPAPANTTKGKDTQGLRVPALAPALARERVRRLVFMLASEVASIFGAGLRSQHRLPLSVRLTALAGRHLGLHSINACTAAINGDPTPAHAPEDVVSDVPGCSVAETRLLLASAPPAPEPVGTAALLTSLDEAAQCRLAGALGGLAGANSPIEHVLTEFVRNHPNINDLSDTQLITQLTAAFAADESLTAFPAVPAAAAFVAPAPAAAAARAAVVARCLRPRAANAALTAFVDAALPVASVYPARPALSTAAEATSLQHVHRVFGAGQPVLVLTSPGLDASSLVYDLAAAQGLDPGTAVSAFAFGSEQCNPTALRRAIKATASRAVTVLVTNVHLAPDSFLLALTRIVVEHTTGEASAGGLVLTAQITEQLPTGLVGLTARLTVEAQDGLAADVRSAIAAPAVAAALAAPCHPLHTRAVLNLTLLHCILAQRSRYAPLGFTKVYEFVQPDLDAAVRQTSQLLAALARTQRTGARGSVDDSFPSTQVAGLVTESVYGPKLDTSADRAILLSLARHLLSPKALTPGFGISLLPTCTDFTTPPGLDTLPASAITAWATAMPAVEPLGWLSLPESGRTLLLEAQSAAAAAVAARLSADSLAAASEADGKAAWAGALAADADGWRSVLDEAAQALTEAGAAGHPEQPSPMQHFAGRELAVAQDVVRTLRGDVDAVLSVLVHGGACSDRVSAVLAGLRAARTPATWWSSVPFSAPAGAPTQAPGVFISHIRDRAVQTSALWVASAAGATLPAVALGLCWAPSAFLTATRQESVTPDAPLESLHLHICTEGGWRLAGTRLAGARWGAAGVVADEAGASINVGIEWAKQPSEGAEIPFYLDGDRSSLVFMARVPPGESTTTWPLLGVCGVFSPW